MSLVVDFFLEILEEIIVLLIFDGSFVKFWVDDLL